MKKETTEETKPKRKYHRVPKEYKVMDDGIRLKAAPKLIEYIEVIRNIIEQYSEDEPLKKEHWESLKNIAVDVTECIKDNENVFIRKDPEEVRVQKYHTKPTLLYGVHERFRMNAIKDFLHNFDNVHLEKDPDEYRLFYAWQIYGHIYFYMTERDKI